MQGSPETHRDITSRIASLNRQTVISIDYAKAPEHPFPAAITQCCAVADWVRDKATTLNIYLNRISVGGDSAGGNLAAAPSLMLRDDGFALRGQLLIYPASEFDSSRPSYRENYNSPLLQVAGMAKVNAMDCPNPQDLSHPLAAPLHAASHAGLAAAMICTAEFDPLRDSGPAYTEALENAGVPVTRDAGPGLIHGYLRAMGYCAPSMASLQRMAAWLQERNQI